MARNLEPLQSKFVFIQSGTMDKELEEQSQELTKYLNDIKEKHISKIAHMYAPAKVKKRPRSFRRWAKKFFDRNNFKLVEFRKEEDGAQLYIVEDDSDLGNHFSIEFRITMENKKINITHETLWLKE